MNKNPKKPISSDDEIYRGDLSAINDFETSSVTECTGLIPSAPENEYELNSYKELFDFSPDTIDIYKKYKSTQT